MANLGALYKTKAEESKGIEQFELLSRSEEALQDSLNLRKKLHGERSKEVMMTAVHLSSTLRLNKKENQAENLLLDTLAAARETLGSKNLLVATILNNLGLLLKFQRRFADSKQFYEDSFEIRRFEYPIPAMIVSMFLLEIFWEKTIQMRSLQCITSRNFT